MTRIATLTDEQLPELGRSILDFAKASLGWIPNIFRVCANSPSALSGFAVLESSLSQALDYQLRTQIALAVSQVNDAEYCLAGHSFYAASRLNLSREEIAFNRAAASSDDRTNAALYFACRVAEARGHVSDEDLASVRRAGFRDGEIVDIVAVVAATCFTNFLNSVAQTEVDHPSPGEVN